MTTIGLTTSHSIENGAATPGQALLAQTVKIGSWYKHTVTNTSASGTIRVRLGNTGAASSEYANETLNPSETMAFTFFSTATTLNQTIDTNNSTIGVQKAFDNVFIDEVLALSGWSAANGALLSIDLAELSIENGIASAGQATRNGTTESNVWYQYTITNTSAAGTIRVRLGNSGPASSEYVNDTLNQGETKSFRFLSTATTLNQTVDTNSAVLGTIKKCNDILIEEMPALQGWTATNVDPSIDNGELRLENTSAAAGFLSKAFDTVSGIVYDFTWTDPQSDQSPPFPWAQLLGPQTFKP